MNKYTKIRDFHGARSTGVGSSDIPTLAGLSRRYKSTTLKLWESKTGRAEPWNGNERTRVGKDLEAYTLARFVEEKYGEEVADKFYMAALRERSWGQFKVKTEARHPERRYCLAHADLLIDGALEWIDRPVPGDIPDLMEHVRVPGEPYIVEAKTVGAFAAKRREGEVFSGYDLEDRSAQGIPDSVYLQVQWQLYCYGVQTAWVAALIDNQYYTFGPIAADPKVQQSSLALAERFWRLVEADTPPAPETWDDVVHLYPHQADTTAMVAGNDESRVREMIARDKDLAARAKALEEERDDIKNAIGVLLGQNQILASAEGEVLAKSTEQSRESVTVMTRAKEIAKAQGKKNPAPLTPEEIEIVAMAARIRELGLVSTSSFRTVRY